MPFPPNPVFVVALTGMPPLLLDCDPKPVVPNEFTGCAACKSVGADEPNVGALLDGKDTELAFPNKAAAVVPAFG
jgi:hypothetical protein